MYSLRTDLTKAAVAVKASIQWLEPSELSELIVNVETRFQQRPGSILWEKISTGERDPDGWRRIARMVAALHVVLIGESSPGVFDAVCLDGQRLEELLEESPPFSMYVTDHNASFVAVHNDHDYLIIEDPNRMLQSES